MPPPPLSIPSTTANQHTRFSDAYALLHRAVEERIFPGAAFGILAGEKVLALDGVGRFTYDPASPIVSAATIYDLASITKVLSTTAMGMLLWDRGQLPLDAPITDWLPEFADPDMAGERHRVTVRMLFAHCSGLPGYAPLYKNHRDAASLEAACLRLPLEAAPATRVEYSDPGFILLGKVLEKISGETIDSFTTREIFEPAGMTSARFRPPADWASSIPPTEEDRSFRHRVLRGEVQDENCYVLGGISGHAGLFSNTLDPLRFASILLADASLTGASRRRLFSPDVIQLFTTRTGMPPGSSRALGWDTPSIPSSSGRYFSPRSAGHLGYSGTSLWIDFDSSVAIVLLTNRTWPQRGDNRIRQLRPAFHDAVRLALNASAARY